MSAKADLDIDERSIDLFSWFVSCDDVHAMLHAHQSPEIHARKNDGGGCNQPSISTCLDSFLNGKRPLED